MPCSARWLRSSSSSRSSSSPETASIPHRPHRGVSSESLFRPIHLALSRSHLHTTGTPTHSMLYCASPLSGPIEDRHAQSDSGNGRCRRSGGQVGCRIGLTGHSEPCKNCDNRLGHQSAAAAPQHRHCANPTSCRGLGLTRRCRVWRVLNNGDVALRLPRRTYSACILTPGTKDVIVMCLMYSMCIMRHAWPIPKAPHFHM